MSQFSVTFREVLSPFLAVVIIITYSGEGDLLYVRDLNGDTIFQAEGESAQREGMLREIDEGGF